MLLHRLLDGNVSHVKPRQGQELNARVAKLRALQTLCAVLKLCLTYRSLAMRLPGSHCAPQTKESR